MTVPYNDLELRSDALAQLGFTTVAWEEHGFVAVRMKTWWAWGIREVVLVRVHREAHFNREMGEAGRRTLDRLIRMYNPSKLFRGLGVFWSLLDVVLADSADEEGLRWASRSVGMGFARSSQTAVVTPDRVHPWSSPLWGAAYQPSTRHIFEVVTTGQVGPAPSAPLAVLLGIATIWPSWLFLALGCCGIPLIPVLVLVSSETPPVPAIRQESSSP